MWYSIISIPKPRRGFPVASASFSQVQQQRFGAVLRQQGVFPVDVPVEPEPRPADLGNRLDPRCPDRPDRVPVIVAAPAMATKRDLDCQARLIRTSIRHDGINRVTRRATSISLTPATKATSGK